MSPFPQRNWSRSLSFTPDHLARPSSVFELQSLVRSVASRKGNIRIVGSGHSFSALIQTSDTLLSLDSPAFKGIESVYRHENGQPVVRVRGGTKLKKLGKDLAWRGLAMTNLGDIDSQALAGAIATGTHGTGVGLGSISSQVVAMEIVLADGSLLHCSESENTDVFHAAQVSLGALGVVVSVDLLVQPSYNLHVSKTVMDLEDCLSRAAELAAAHRHFEFIWLPHTRKTIVKLSDPTTQRPSVISTLIDTAKELTLDDTAFGLICRLARHNPTSVPALGRLISKLMGGDESTYTAPSRRALIGIRLVKFQEMEYALPAARGIDAMREIVQYVERHNVPVLFPVQFRYVAADDIWLSPFYRQYSVAISVQQFVGMEYEEYFGAAEEILRKHGGRPHWGKMHGIWARELRELYPRWEDFQRVRMHVDPQGVFMNDLLGHWFENKDPECLGMSRRA